MIISAYATSSEMAAWLARRIGLSITIPRKEDTRDISVHCLVDDTTGKQKVNERNELKSYINTICIIQLCNGCGLSNATLMGSTPWNEQNAYCHGFAMDARAEGSDGAVPHAVTPEKMINLIAIDMDEIARLVTKGIADMESKRIRTVMRRRGSIISTSNTNPTFLLKTLRRASILECCSIIDNYGRYSVYSTSTNTEILKMNNNNANTSMTPMRLSAISNELIKIACERCSTDILYVLGKRCPDITLREVLVIGASVGAVSIVNTIIRAMKSGILRLTDLASLEAQSTEAVVPDINMPLPDGAEGARGEALDGRGFAADARAEGSDGAEGARGEAPDGVGREAPHDALGEAKLPRDGAEGARPEGPDGSRKTEDCKYLGQLSDHPVSVYGNERSIFHMNSNQLRRYVIDSMMIASKVALDAGTLNILCVLRRELGTGVK